jgi:5-methylcytosine-specific restriction endonuclease McrA
VEVRNAGQADPLAYYHGHSRRDKAPLLDELMAVIDHVEAFSTGGPDSAENLCTSCAKCNGRKSSAPLDRWGQREKRSPIKGKYGEPQHWDGLVSVFVMLAERNPASLTVVERDWLKAIKLKAQQ